MKQRDQLFQQKICNPTEKNKGKSRQTRSEVTHAIRCAKRDYIYEKLGKIPSLEKLYQVLKKEKRNYQPTLKTPIAETFDHYFSIIEEKLAKRNLEKLSESYRQFPSTHE